MRDFSPKRRTFELIRVIILTSLSSGRKTINQIATQTGINWRTVELHLVHLVGRAFVKEVFSSEYVRIFEITEKGKLLLSAKHNNLPFGFADKINRDKKEVHFSVNV